MKDNRSLEQKIRKLVHESNRNTELRKKEPNVGRPTGDNKLAKQGEIQRKIIEDSEYGMARNELETAKRAIDRLNTKMGKGEGELEAWVQSKITKAADYLDTVADYIESGSVKEEAIEEDTAVASVSTKDTPKEQPEPKNKKKDDGKDLMEPGTIKGGKTEVDLEPTTDDRDDDGKKISDKMKKATKAANAHAGVKEETMNTTKHFGLPADLIAAVTEALKGGQKKLDKNHNGKIDGQDFKILRKEEVVDEERMSKGRRDALARKTSFTADPPRRLEKPEPKETKSDKIKAYRADRDKHMEEEVEELDERDAGNKAKKDAAVAAVGAANKDEKHLTTKGTGIRGSVADKIRGREVTSGKDRMKEEVEILDELSKGTVSSYKEKSDSEINKKAPVGPGSTFKNRMKREKGNFLANKKLSGKAKVNATEETDPGFSAEELARLEEIASNIDEVVTARKLTPADKAAKAKYIAAHKAKLASHDTGIEPKKSFKDVNSEPGNYTKEPSKMGIRHSIGAGYYKNDT